LRQPYKKALGQYECDQLAGIQAAAAAKPENWTARAWQLERWAPDRYGRRDRLDVSGTMTVAEMRAFFVAVLQLMERYVPPERREAEANNLIAVVDELASRHGPQAGLGGRGRSHIGRGPMVKVLLAAILAVDSVSSAKAGDPVFSGAHFVKEISALPLGSEPVLHAEPHVAVDPNNPSVVVAVFVERRNTNCDPRPPSCPVAIGFATSHDGGRTWVTGNLPA
jgi:hypothetical protein